ncbi:ABC transporter permease [Nonomuraea sp. NPDC050556]|uniref:ABC transporter permease n=1 Tax=Nonomuraea sp. NPDC050556 TaxID=3364369 RepID=UPI0037BC9D67
MIGFALKTLKHRKAGFTGAFVALVFAAALVCACGMLLDTGLRGSVTPERYAGAPVIVTGDQFVRQVQEKGKTKEKPLSEHAWIPAELADQVKAMPGVEKVVTEVTFPAGEAQGHGWESAALTPFTIAEGHEPRGADEVVADRGEIGRKITLNAKTYRVVGITQQQLPSQETIFFQTQEARRLANRPGQLSAIGVFPDVPIKVEKGVVYTGDDRGKVEFLDAEKSRVQLISLGGALGGTSLLVAVLVVIGTFALSVQQRQRELALLRAVAATPKQLRKMLGSEALVVGLAGGLVGSALGVGVGFWLRGRFVALGAMPANLPLVVSPFPMIAAVGATVLAAWAAARVSARRTARIRPVEALGEAAAPSAKLPVVRLVAGVLFFAAGVVMAVVLSGLRTESAASPVVMLTALLWSISVSLLAPAVPKFGLGGGTTGFLARRNVRAGAKRFGSVLSPLTLMVAMACTTLFVQTTMDHAATEQAAAGNRADYRLTGASAAAVAKLPGVESVTEVLRTSVRIDLDKYAAQAVSGTGEGIDLGVTQGTMAGFGKDSIAVSRSAADRLEVGVGGQVSLTLGDGTPAVLKVAAIYERHLAFGELTLPHELVAAHVDNPYGVLLVKGGSLDTLAKVARVDPVMGSSGSQAVNFVAMGLIIAFTAIAVVNTLAMSTSDRSRELALLRLVGTTRRQVLRMLRLETAAAVLTSVVIGTVIAAVTLVAFSLGMTGSALPYVPPLTYVAVIAAAAALALAATVLPARLALRQRPADAVGARQ